MQILASGQELACSDHAKDTQSVESGQGLTWEHYLSVNTQQPPTALSSCSRRSGSPQGIRAFFCSPSPLTYEA